MGENESESRSISRRRLCVGAGSVAVLLGAGALRFTPAQALVRPPGGQDEESILAKCIHCERCVESCPRRVITMSHLEDGVLLLRTPKMRYESDYCDGCAAENNGIALCTQNCPTGALQELVGSTEKSMKLGVAVIDDTCLARRQTFCHTCYEACPYKAMELDSNSRPCVITDKCNGCGACEAACVSLTAGSKVAGATTRAITVRVSEGR